MSLSAIIAIVVCLLVATAVYAVQRSRSYRAQQKASAIRYLKQLKELIVILQKHRGLSSAILNGDNSQQHTLHELQQKVMGYHQQLGSELYMQRQERWYSFSQHWARLQQSWQRNNLENNIAQHSLMIKNLLYLAQDVASFHQLAELSKDHPQIEFIWHDLLLTAESIGQARALGSGLAAAGHSTSVERIRLAFLHNKISQMDTQLLEYFVRNFAPKESSYQNGLDQLLSTIEDELINQEQPTIAVNDYFQLASKVLDGMYRLFDAGLVHLESNNPRS